MKDKIKTWLKLYGVGLAMIVGFILLLIAL